MEVQIKELFISSNMSPETFLETLVQLNACLEHPKTQPELINVYVEQLNSIFSNQLFKDLVNTPEYTAGTGRKVRTRRHLNDMSRWLRNRYTFHQKNEAGILRAWSHPPCRDSYHGP